MEKSVPSEIGFADGEIESYQKVADVLTVRVKAWNERLLEVTFRDVLRLSDFDAGDIHDLRELSGESDFYKKALDHVYDSRPDVVPYRHYSFIGIEGDGVLDVVAETVAVEVVGVPYK